MRVERDQFPVNHRLMPDLGKRRADRRIFVRDVVAIAGIKRGMAWGSHDNGAETVPLRLEHPVLIVERFVGERGQHRTEIEFHRDRWGGSCLGS